MRMIWQLAVVSRAAGSCVSYWVDDSVDSGSTLPLSVNGMVLLSVIQRKAGLRVAQRTCAGSMHPNRSCWAPAA
jgi:hypothetical protein